MFAITVVIPVHSNRDRVARTIRSAVAQPDVDVRVIAVIDDQCRESRAIIEQFGVDILFNKRTMGGPWCRNLGLALATTRYVMFLDSDDYVEGPLLAALCRRMDATGADIGLGRTVCEFENGRPRKPLPMPAEPGRAMFEQWCLEEAYSAPCSVVWDAAFLRSIGGWDETLKRSQDSELVLRALLRGARTCAVTEGAGIYVQHESAHRITRSRDYSSCLVAAEKLLTVPTSLPRDFVERVIARRAVRIAARAFDVYDAALTAKSLAFARRLGLRARPGRPATQWLTALIGIDATLRLRGWIMPRLKRTPAPARSAGPRPDLAPALQPVAG